MTPKPRLQATAGPRPSGIRGALAGLSGLGLASVLILGPITGGLTALCLFNLRKSRPVYAACCIAGIVAFWVAGPALLRGELSFLLAHNAGVSRSGHPSATASRGPGG